MSQSNIKERTKPPVDDEHQEDDLEQYQGKWGIMFHLKDGRSGVDPDEIHDTQESAQARIDEFFSIRSFLMWVRITGYGRMPSMNVVSCYPIPIAGD